MDRPQIARRAYRALQECGLEVPAFDPLVVASHQGATVVEHHADDSESGFCLRDDDRIVIGFNNAHHVHRQRFTIAHEVGHLLLHHGRALTVDKAVRISYRNEISSMATDFQEIEANAFAAALLMPQNHVRQHASPLVDAGLPESEIVEQLSKTFDVSNQAMTFRLLNLGIFLG